MSPIQQLFLGQGAVATKTYVDDVFSTYLWKGDGNLKTINNSLKLASGLNLALGTYIQGGYFQGTFTDNSVEYALIVAPIGAGNNNGTMVSYGSSSTSAGATSTTNGPANTATLAAASGSWPAADWAYALSLNGYSDWYLPAKDELTLLQQNQGTLPSGQAWLQNWDTWSSTEINSTYAWMIHMSNGAWSNTDNKTKTRHVRAIRRVTVASLSSYSVTGEGGLVWIKQRNSSNEHVLFDTARGATKALVSSSNASETTISDGLTSFLPYGFQIDDNARTGASTDTYSSWTFRKAPGFFDVVTYDGDSGAPNWGTSDIAHNLKCLPGLIILKKTNGTGGWWVYHRDLPATTNAAWSKVLRLDSSGAEQTAYNLGTASYHTATTFRVGNDNSSNNTGDSYVAYLFAGGKSDAATARSLTFDGSYDSLQLASSNDFNFGTGDFTFEGWLKPNNNTNYQVFLNWGSDNPNIGISNDSNSYIYYNSTVNTKIAGIAAVGQWTHYAISRSSGTTRLFLNGELKNSFSDSHNYGAQAMSIGAYINGNNSWNGSISNVRIVKGTAVYTSSFRPPTEPLTNITNTKLLCCNNSSTTGSTVTPGTITAENNVTASTDSPFDDPAGFAFGELGSESVVKCGSYVGTGQSTSGTGTAGPNINLGWEPQWILVKCATDVEHWELYDSMRGIVTGGSEPCLEPNLSNAESQNDRFSLTPTGFQIETGSGSVNGNGKTYVYFAIRRPDPLVQKPQLATDVFAMDNALDVAGLQFTSNFPVDFALARRPASVEDWFASGRLIDKTYLRPSNTSASAASSLFNYDSNVGYASTAWGSDYQSWMWKRSAGFDLVTYAGGQNIYNSSLGASDISHSLGKVPEMLWVKRRNSSENWVVYHKGFNGGTNPENYRMFLNSTGTATTFFGWAQTAFTSTHFTVADGAWVNGSGSDYVAFLFASTDVSKVGSYTGNGSTGQTITLGFQPRFVIIRKYNDAAHWLVLDTTRGWGSGDDKYLLLNSSGAQGDYEVGAPTSNGFTLVGDNDYNNSSGAYIYYAHA